MGGTALECSRPSAPMKWSRCQSHASALLTLLCPSKRVSESLGTRRFRQVKIESGLTCLRYVILALIRFRGQVNYAVVASVVGPFWSFKSITAARRRSSEHESLGSSCRRAAPRKEGTISEAA